MKQLNLKAIIEKAIKDKKAIRECIQSNGDLNKLAHDRGIKFVKPV